MTDPALGTKPSSNRQSPGGRVFQPALHRISEFHPGLAPLSNICGQRNQQPRCFNLHSPKFGPLSFKRPLTKNTKGEKYGTESHIANSQISKRSSEVETTRFSGCLLKFPVDRAGNREESPWNSVSRTPNVQKNIQKTGHKHQ